MNMPMGMSVVSHIVGTAIKWATEAVCIGYQMGMPINILATGRVCTKPHPLSTKPTPYGLNHTLYGGLLPALPCVALSCADTHALTHKRSPAKPRCLVLLCERQRERGGRSVVKGGERYRPHGATPRPRPCLLRHRRSSADPGTHCALCSVCR